MDGIFSKILNGQIGCQLFNGQLVPLLRLENDQAVGKITFINIMWALV